VIQGSVYGGVQTGAHATQHISLQVLQVDENIRHLRDLVERSSLPELDKEELGLTLDRISQLSRKKQEPGVLEKMKEKLELVGKTLAAAKGIADQAAPYIAAIAQWISQQT
jgi:hypothetical protein